MKAWLNIKDASAYISTSTRSLRRYVNDPIEPIPHSYLGNQLRFHKSDLDSWLWFKKPYHKLTNPQKEMIIERSNYLK